MKVLLPAAAAAVLMVSPVAFAAGPAPATQPTQPMSAPMSGAAHHAAHHHAMTAAGWSSSTTALNLLEAQGYGSFTDFRRDGQDYAATVSQNGKSFPVKIDPATGQVTRG
ncbi:MAG: PepSY domain-containing protein [Stellaceae bacterium]